MERNIEILTYLLARLIAKNEGISEQQIYSEIEALFPKPKRAARTTIGADKDAVEKIYALYPTKCPISGRSTGKSSKDKERIGRMLQTIGEDKLAATIKKYVEDSVAAKSYIKNFSTFLNNIPEIDETPTIQFEQQTEQGTLNDPEAEEWIRQRRKIYNQ